jgi:hypothetical protein
MRFLHDEVHHLLDLTVGLILSHFFVWFVDSFDDIVVCFKHNGMKSIDLLLATNHRSESELCVCECERYESERESVCE